MLAREILQPRRPAFWLVGIGFTYVLRTTFGVHRQLSDWAEYLGPGALLERLVATFDDSATTDLRPRTGGVFGPVDINATKKVPNLRFFLEVDNDVEEEDNEKELEVPARKLDAGAGEQEMDHRPILVLHIGPHKTASSTIQCELTYFQKLLQDRGNFTYLGREYTECQDPQKVSTRYKIDTRQIVRCLENHSKENPCDKTNEWRIWEKMLKSMQNANLNVVLSDEAFSRMRIKKDSLSLLFMTIEQHGFHLRLAMVYRHYFAWLLSQYNEHYKPLPNRRVYKEWPGEGGKSARPFAEYYSKAESEGRRGTFHSPAALGNYQLAADRLNLHPVAYLRKLWTHVNISSAPKDVTIVDLHDINGDGIVVNFVRQALSEPLANDILKQKQDQAGEIPWKENPSVNLDYDMLVTRARDVGLFPKLERLPRRGMALYTEHALHRKINVTLPYICLSENDIQHFVDRSLDLEESVFPQISEDRRRFHRNDFEEAIRRHKHCNLDTKKLLQDERVQDFFRNIPVPKEVNG